MLPNFHCGLLLSDNHRGEYPAGPIVFRSQCNALNKASYHSLPPSPRDFTSHSPISVSTLEKHPLPFGGEGISLWTWLPSLTFSASYHFFLSGFHNSVSEVLTITFTKDSLPRQIQSSLSSWTQLWFVKKNYPNLKMSGEKKECAFEVILEVAMPNLPT